MLVIRRHAGQSILIGDSIEIQIVEITPTKVKLGIVAPAQVTVLRKEVALTEQENRAAAGSVDTPAISALLNRLKL